MSKLINMSLLINMDLMSSQASSEQYVAALFRQHGWTVEPRSGPGQPDLVVEQGSFRYAIEIKSSGEPRTDRLLGRLAEAIVESRSHAETAGAAPLAVIVAPPMSPLVVKALFRYKNQYADDVAIGVVDRHGFSRFQGDGLDALDANPQDSTTGQISHRPAGHLFSDLNQWMLKVLLAPRIPQHLLNAPRGDYRNVSELARAAGVSVMSAFRLQQLLLADGFLDDGGSPLRVVRVPELLRQWQASYLRPPHDLPMQWLLARPTLPDAVRRYDHARDEGGPRACLGLFAAAEALDVNVVHGVPPHLYLERLAPRALQQFGLRPASAGQPPDVFVRVARPRESLLRGAVERDGVPAADVLQVWLDVSNYPARGAEQAEQIRRTVLHQLLT